MLLNYFLAWSIFEILKGVWMRQGFLRVRKRIKMDVICYFELKIKLNLFVSKGPSTDMQIYQGLIPRFHTSVLKALASKKPVIVWGWRKRDFLPLFFKHWPPSFLVATLYDCQNFKGLVPKGNGTQTPTLLFTLIKSLKLSEIDCPEEKQFVFLMPNGRRIQMFFFAFLPFLRNVAIVPVTTYNFLRP